MDENAFTGLEAATVKDVGPDGEECLWQSSSLDEGKAIGDWQDQRGVGDAIFSVAATADEGADGTITVEKWDDVSGSNQTAMTAAITLNAGAAAIVALTALTTTDAEIAAGYKINVVTAGVDASPAGRVTLFFQKMEAAGDVYVGALLYDAEFLGGYWEQDGDEGTDGTITIEKWDDAAGSNQTSISAAGVVDAGAASMEEISAVSDGEEVVAAGYKINVKLATFDRAPSGRVTLFFKHVDDVDT